MHFDLLALAVMVYTVYIIDQCKMHYNTKVAFLNAIFGLLFNDLCFLIYASYVLFTAIISKYKTCKLIKIKICVKHFTYLQHDNELTFFAQFKV